MQGINIIHLRDGNKIYGAERVILNLINKIAVEGYNAIKRRFSAERMARKYGRIYEGLLGRNET